ncbi:MAG: glycosyltransferase [Sphingobacteriaceae bacterium]|nr:MAG: glycosyltransferase [Sphingobacteriaceae bacterium]
MHVGLFTYGSRGDVQPFIALALGLIDNGHQVTLAAPANFRELVEGYGVTFYALYGNAEEIVSSAECRRIIKSGNNIAFTRFMFNAMHQMRHPLFDSIYSACLQVDVIITVNTFILFLGIIAEKMNKKWAIVQLNPPMIPTREFPYPMMNIPSVSWLNKSTYNMVNYLVWQLGRKDVLEFRQKLELPIFKRSMVKIWEETYVPVIHAYSPQIIPRPADWEEQYTVAGFFDLPFVKDGNNIVNQVPAGLTDWLNSGDKPLYIGFGSIPVPDAELLKNIILEVLTKTNTRIVFCTGWSKILDMPAHPSLFVINRIDHAWLFPKCKAAVIHGGIGTLAAVLKAGIPVIVASIFADQPTWGRIVQTKGNGVHIPFKKLSASRLMKALQLTEQLAMVNAAIDMGKKISRESGVGNAVASIEKYCL